MDPKKEVFKSNSSLQSFFIIVSILIIITLWISTPFLIPIWITYFYSDPNVAAPGLGEVGDMFGAVNAIFSGFALSGIIVAIFLQRADLKLQQKELQETRIEFQINRITNVIYKQLDRIEGLLDNSNFSIGNSRLSLKAFSVSLQELIEKTIIPDSEKDFRTIHQVMYHNAITLITILEYLYNSGKIITRLTSKNNFPTPTSEKIKWDLISLFLENLDSDLRKIIKSTRIISEWYFAQLREQKFPKNERMHATLAQLEKQLKKIEELPFLEELENVSKAISEEGQKINIT